MFFRGSAGAKGVPRFGPDVRKGFGLVIMVRMLGFPQARDPWQGIGVDGTTGSSDFVCRLSWEGFPYVLHNASVPTCHML